MSILTAALLWSGMVLQDEDPRLAQIKKLAGDWTIEGMDGVAVRYRVTSGGSAVVETMFPDTDKEMVTIYTIDGKDLRLTHYCMLNNQPSMHSGKLEKGVLKFVCDGKPGNTAAHDDQHMHGLTMTFVDDDHFRQEWTMFAAGKEKAMEKFEYRRKK